jgi:hypothetical protein
MVISFCFTIEFIAVYSTILLGVDYQKGDLKQRYGEGGSISAF